jgi:hypothetical protein
MLSYHNENADILNSNTLLPLEVVPPSSLLTCTSPWNNSTSSSSSSQSSILSPIDDFSSSVSPCPSFTLTPAAYPASPPPLVQVSDWYDEPANVAMSYCAWSSSTEEFDQQIKESVSSVLKVII